MPWIQYASRKGQVELIYRTPDAFTMDSVSEFQHLPPGIPDEALVIVDGEVPRFWHQLEEAARYVKQLAADASRGRAKCKEGRFSKRCWLETYDVVVLPPPGLFGPGEFACGHDDLKSLAPEVLREAVATGGKVARRYR